MKSGNRDKVEGTAKILKGRVKEAAGRATKNPRLVGEGQEDRAKGRVQKTVGSVKKALNR